MSKLNLQIGLNSYADKVETNQNLLNHFKWLRSVSGVLVDNPESSELLISAGDTLTLFNGSVVISQDNTTKYSISLMASGVYKLSYSNGAAPQFRTERILGLDNTSEVTFTKNGPLMTATFTDGTLPNLATVLVGDEIRIVNIGIYKVLGKTSNSISWENESGVEQTIVLNSSADIRVYSSSGVQRGQKVSITNGFSVASYGDYEITDASPDFLVFNSTKTLPEESDILSQVSIYKSEKKILFLESTSEITVLINGSNQTKVSPLISSSSNHPGLLLLTGSMYSAEILNSGIQEVTIYYISAE